MIWSLVLGACATAEPSEAKRAVIARAALKMPAELLPPRGVYAAGGGLTSTPWRITVDYDSRLLTAGRGKVQSGSSTGALEQSWSHVLTPAQVSALGTLTEHAWQVSVPPNLHPTADYDEVLAVVDHDAAFWAEGFGPLTGPPADVVTELRKLAGDPP